MKVVVTVRIVISGVLMFFLLLAELVFLIWIKISEQLVKRPQIITFGLNAKGATFVIRKAAQRIRWLLVQIKERLLITFGDWLWEHFRPDLIQYYPSVHRKGQQVYDFFQRIRNFLSGP